MDWRAVSGTLIAWLLILFSGCGFHVRYPPVFPVTADLSPQPGEGVLVLETDSNEDVHGIEIRSTSGEGIVARIGGIKGGRRTQFVMLPAADYRVSQVEFSGISLHGRHYPYIWTLSRNDLHWRFSVKPGVVNYPGVIVLIREQTTRLSAFTLNRSGEFVDRLRKHSSSILRNLDLRYSGRGRDDFLDFYSQRIRADSSDSPRPESSSPGGADDAE